MTRARIPELVHALRQATHRRAVLALVGVLPVVLGATEAPQAEARKARQSANAEHNRKHGKRKRFCKNGRNVSAKNKKKKRRLRRQGAARGRCVGPGPVGCNCSAGEICVYDVCHPCTVTCTGTPEACGADLATALIAGGDIYICPGHYAGTFTVSVADTALFGAGSGEDTATDTVIDARQAGTVFTVLNGIQGHFAQLRITGGEVLGGIGGGIFMYHGKGVARAAPLVVDACTFAGNASGGGSGIVTDGQITVSNSLFTANTSTGGGAGILLDSVEEPLVHSITNCTFTDNTSDGDGGAVWIRQQPVTFAGCTFASNNANDGGAIYATADLTPINIDLDNQTLIDGNSATGGGSSAGGITAAEAATVNLNGATVRNNTPNDCSGVTGC